MVNKITKILLLGFTILLYLNIFQLPYYVWSLGLTQNWLEQNGLIIYRDIIYHHMPLPLLSLSLLGNFLGNTSLMLQIFSFILGLFFGLGIFLTVKLIYKKAALVSLLILIFTFSPMLNNFNAEEMMAAVFTLYSVYFFVLFYGTKKELFIFMSGLLSGLAFMSKQVSIAVIIAFAAVSVWEFFEGRRELVYRRTILRFVLGLAVGIIPFVAYYSLNGGFFNFIYWTVIFNLTVYPSQSAPYALNEGMLMSFWLILSLIPAIWLLFKEKIDSKLKFGIRLLALSTVLLYPSILPSFLAYKIPIFYPYPVILWAIVFCSLSKKQAILAIALWAIAVLPVVKPFYTEYLSPNIFHGSLILDYGDDEVAVANWLKKNTQNSEKIMNLGNSYIDVMAKRLPQNRYVYIFPWLVLPYGESAKEILANPPKIVVIDLKTLQDWPILEDKWRFIPEVRKNYKLVQTYGSYEIYVL